MIGSCLSLAFRIILLHAIAWGLEWNEIGWNRVEVSAGEESTVEWQLLSSGKCTYQLLGVCAKEGQRERELKGQRDDEMKI